MAFPHQNLTLNIVSSICSCNIPLMWWITPHLECLVTAAIGKDSLPPCPAPTTPRLLFCIPTQESCSMNGEKELYRTRDISWLQLCEKGQTDFSKRARGRPKSWKTNDNVSRLVAESNWQDQPERVFKNILQEHTRHILKTKHHQKEDFKFLRNTLGTSWQD